MIDSASIKIQPGVTHGHAPRQVKFGAATHSAHVAATCIHIGASPPTHSPPAQFLTNQSPGNCT